MVKLLRHLVHELIVHCFPQFIKKRLMSCEEAAKLLDSQTSLPVFTKVSLNVHVAICQCCTNYKKQLNSIRESIQNSNALPLDSAEAQNRIKSSKRDILNKINK